MILAGFAFLAGWVVLVSAAGFPLCFLLAEREPSSDSFEVAEFVFLGWFLGTLSVGWVALTLLQAGLFAPWRVVLLTVAVPLGVLGLVHRRNSRLSLPALRATWFTGLSLVLCVGALALFARPAEFVLGGGDAGVYVNLGAIWSESGSFRFEEPGLAALPPDAGSSLFRQARTGHVIDALRFPGFYLSGAEPGVVTPQFFPLHPVWMALAYGLLGLEASLFATPLWAAMGLLAIVLTARRLFGTPTGVLAGAFLLLTPLQIYFARYPTAEALTQFLIWGSLFALAAFFDGGGRVWGIVSGVALGQVFLTRIDALPLLIVPGLWLLLTIVHGTWRRSRWVLVPFGLLMLQSLLQSLLLSWPYTWEVYHSLGNHARKLLGQVGWVIPVSVGLGAVAYILLKGRGASLTARTASLARKGAALLILVLAAYAYFVWPVVGETATIPYWYGGSTIPLQNHLNFVKLGWYLSPLGLALGLAGIIWIVLRENWQRVWPVLAVGLSFSILYLYDIMNNPYHIYAMRRYVPAVLPFFVIGMAYTVAKVGVLPDRGGRARCAAGFVACILGGLLLYNSRSVWNLVEFRGLTSQMQAVADSLEPEAVLLFDDRGPVGVGATVGTSLQYLFGFTVFDLQEDYVQEESLRQLISDWQLQGRGIYWVAGPQPTLGLPAWLNLEPELGSWLRTERLEASYHDFPEKRVAYTVPLEFYRVVAGSAHSSCSLPASVDVGSLDAAYLQSGFHGKELLGSRSIRWTDGAAAMKLPCLPPAETDFLTLSVTAAAVRAAGAAPVNVTLSADGQALGEFVLGREFEELRAPLPRSLSGGDVVVSIESDTWVPFEAGVGDDSRSLGILIDSVQVSIANGHE